MAKKEIVKVKADVVVPEEKKENLPEICTCHQGMYGFFGDNSSVVRGDINCPLHGPEIAEGQRRLSLELLKEVKKYLLDGRRLEQTNSFIQSWVVKTDHVLKLGEDPQRLPIACERIKKVKVRSNRRNDD